MIQILKLVVYILLSAKRRACFSKSIAIELGGVSRYFSKVLGSGVDSTLLKFNLEREIWQKYFFVECQGFPCKFQPLTYTFQTLKDVHSMCHQFTHPPSACQEDAIPKLCLPKLLPSSGGHEGVPKFPQLTSLQIAPKSLLLEHFWGVNTSRGALGLKKGDAQWREV